MTIHDTPILITQPDDARLADYRALKEARLNADSGKFIAESELVVRKLLKSSLVVDSVVLTAARLDTLRPFLRPGVPVYVVTQDVLDTVAGLHVHRGCLAVGRRPQSPQLPERSRLVVALEDLVDTDNLGAMVRNAAAFGADAIMLSPRCADPFYRKAIRTSTGHVFNLPIIRCARWPDDLVALRDRFDIVGATLAPGAVPLPSYRADKPVAVVLGTEGHGLSPELTAICDDLVTIPMSPSGDSLNVAVAGAVVLYELTRRANAPAP